MICWLHIRLHIKFDANNEVWIQYYTAAWSEKIFWWYFISRYTYPWTIPHNAELPLTHALGETQFVTDDIRYETVKTYWITFCHFLHNIFDTWNMRNGNVKSISIWHRYESVKIDTKNSLTSSSCSLRFSALKETRKGWHWWHLWHAKTSEHHCRASEMVVQR